MGASEGRTVLAVVSASFCWIFFDQAKHNAILAVHAGFLDDPYDAVGSFGIQLAAGGALAALAWLVVERFEGRPGWSSRGSAVTAAACLAVGLADLVGQLAGPGLARGGAWVDGGIVVLLLLGVIGLRLSVPAAPGRGESLLRRLGRMLPPAGTLLRWFDQHAVAGGLVIGLLAGIALSVSRLVLEGPPPDTGALVLISGLFLLVEAAVVGIGWVVVGGWLHLHSGI